MNFRDRRLVPLAGFRAVRAAVAEGHRATTRLANNAGCVGNGVGTTPLRVGGMPFPSCRVDDATHVGKE